MSQKKEETVEAGEAVTTKKNLSRAVPRAAWTGPAAKNHFQ